MRPIAAAVLFTLLLAAPVFGIGYALGQLDRQRTEPQQVIGPRGERGLPGRDCAVTDLEQRLRRMDANDHTIVRMISEVEKRLADMESSPDCDCAALKAEAVEYVRQAETRLSKLESENVHDQKMMDQLTAELAIHLKHIEALEKSQCKCKCR